MAKELGADLTRTGQAPSAFIMHHTAGRGTPEGVVNWWKKQGKGYGSQYIMDRDGVIHDTAAEFGYSGTNQIRNGKGVGKGLNNSNVVGMEIIAKNDADVTPAQAAAAAKFIQTYYPTIKLYGHGQVNPNDREATEGMTAINAVNALRKNPDAPVQVATPVGTTINAASAPVAGALANQGGGFMRSVANIESNYRNIPSTVDKDYPGQPGSKSQGYWQIDTPTWRQFGAAAGIDLTKYPNAMSAPPDIQEQVARTIPLGRFGPQTIKKLNQQYETTLDKTQTLGALDAIHGGGAPGAAAATASTGDSTPAAAAPANQPWWAKFATPQTDPKTGKTTSSPLQQAAEAFSPSADKAKSAKELMEEQAPEKSVLASSGPGARNVSQGLQNIAQTYGQTINSFNQPLTWSNAPPRIAGIAPAGFQGSAAPSVPGISLTSVQPGPMGLGYGVEPIGYGYG